MPGEQGDWDSKGRNIWPGEQQREQYDWGMHSRKIRSIAGRGRKGWARGVQDRLSGAR